LVGSEPSGDYSELKKAKPGYKLVKSLFGKEIEIPEEWDVKELKNLAKIKGRIGWRGYSQNDFVEEGKGVISLGGTNIKNDKLDLSKRRYVTFEKYDESPEIQVNTNDILIQKTGTIGGVALIDKNVGKATINPNVSIIKKILCNSLFLSFSLTNSYVKKQINRFKTATSVPLLTQEQISSLIIFVPSKPEQQKIASILSNVVSLISSFDEFLSHTKRLKTGLMQQLLTEGIGHKKFKKVNLGFGKTIEFPEEWKIEKLKENTSKIGSGITPFGGSEVYQKDGIPFIRSQNVHFDGLHLDNVAYITQEIHDKMSGTKLKSMDVLLNITGASIGRCSIVPEKFGEGNVNQHVCIIRSKPSLFPGFLNYFLISSLMQNMINSVQGGISRQGLNFKDLGNLHIPIPKFEEQQKITSILSEVDKKINNLESNKTRLENLKKGLMQNLLTGQIRVTV